MNDTLRNLGKDELVELLEIYAKNLIALDGTWFQSLEREEGMDTAVRHDIEAWRRFSVSEARRIKKFLGLDERPGKGMGFHPCRSVGVVEYGVFAESIDDRISCECLSCFPDMTDDSCNCAWKFTLKA